MASPQLAPTRRGLACSSATSVPVRPSSAPTPPIPSLPLSPYHAVVVHARDTPLSSLPLSSLCLCVSCCVLCVCPAVKHAAAMFEQGMSGPLHSVTPFITALTLCVPVTRYCFAYGCSTCPPHPLLLSLLRLWHQPDARASGNNAHVPHEVGASVPDAAATHRLQPTRAVLAGRGVRAIGEFGLRVLV